MPAVPRRLLAAVALAAAACAPAAAGARGAAGGPGAAASRPVGIVWVGDIAMAPAADGGASFFPASVRRQLRGDVVAGNLEGTLATGGSSKCGPASSDCYAFRAPPSYARLLRRAGFTLVNLANNHAADYGPVGQAETLAALGAAHLRSTGRPGEITVVRAGRTRVAVLGFAPYAWAQSLTDIAAAKRLVRAAAARADLVVCVMHAGAEGADRQHVHPGSEEFLGEDRGDPIAFAHAVVDAGADLVVGSGPHVLRGMEWYRGRLIAYSLGNFLGNGTLSTGGVLGVSGILRVELRPSGAWLRGRLVGVRLLAPGVPRVDPDDTAVRLVRDLSREDFGRNGMRLAGTGRLAPPAWLTG